MQAINTQKIFRNRRSKVRRLSCCLMIRMVILQNFPRFLDIHFSAFPIAQLGIGKRRHKRP